MPRRTTKPKDPQARTLRLPPEWWSELRRMAFEQETSQTELVKEALRKVYGFKDPA
jgi:hypothetical protein